MDRLGTHLDKFHTMQGTLKNLSKAHTWRFSPLFLEDPIVYRLVHANDKIVQEISGVNILGRL